MNVKEIPALHVACVRHVGPYQGDAALFERYLNDPREHPEHKHIVEYLSAREKALTAWQSGVSWAVSFHTRSSLAIFKTPPAYAFEATNRRIRRLSTPKTEPKKRRGGKKVTSSSFARSYSWQRVR